MTDGREDNRLEITQVNFHGVEYGGGQSRLRGRDALRGTAIGRPW